MRASGCIVFAEDYSVYRYTETNDEKKAMVSELSAGFKLLKPYHRFADCSEKAPCYKKWKITGHHGGLCFKRTKGCQNDEKPVANVKKITGLTASTAPGVLMLPSLIDTLAAGCGITTIVAT